MGNCGRNVWKKKAINKITNINIEGRFTDNIPEIADIFNDHYINIGEKLAGEIKADPNYKCPSKNMNNQMSMFLFPTDPIEMKNVIQSLKNKKAVGVDKIRAELLKNTIPFIIEPLVYLINKSFIDGIFPSMLKSTQVIPIYKNGDKNEVINYRPISLITAMAKIFEKIIKTRLSSYLKKYNILSCRQYGFREGVSTQDAILDLTGEMYSAMDNKKASLCVFIDLSKAFDSVSHPLLLKSLENVGIRGTTLTLFQSYLLNRKQCVKIGKHKSKFKNIEYGMPHGTILSPMLFNIYVNDLF